jgi:2-amino-1-hydroxyethylphosphonate dioxygenase (glycine-forming)
MIPIHSTMENNEKTMDEVFALYEKFGSTDYIGEPVSQLEHMSQSAQLAMKEGFDDEVILAAFFHDIGHICEINMPTVTMDGYGRKRHEQIGADFLRSKGFPETIARLVEYHVQAKRYLTFKYPDYYNQLSEASKRTLAFQGGRMTSIEADRFEKDPLFETSLIMRKWDDLAKEVNIPVIDFTILREKVLNVLRKSLQAHE